MYIRDYNNAPMDFTSVGKDFPSINHIERNMIVFQKYSYIFEIYK